MEEEIEAIFATYQLDLDEDHEVREKIKDVAKNLTQISREASDSLQIMHRNITKIPQACLRARGFFEQGRVELVSLRDIVIPGEYYKYHEHWKVAMQTFCFTVALVVWLEKGMLVSPEVVAEIFGLDKEETDLSFHLDIEDYLLGLTGLASELSRFAITSVINEDLQRPIQISKFMTELIAGFRLLNLKNDFLRKKYDSMKYDVKKIEEVVYDLSIRDMLPKTKEKDAEVADDTVVPEVSEPEASVPEVSVPEVLEPEISVTELQIKEEIENL